MKIIESPKICFDCKEPKPKSEFYLRQKRCKKCHNKKTYQRSKEKKNPDRMFIG